MIPLPTTPRELVAFKASQALTDDLRRILDEPTLKLAINALKLASTPTGTPAPVPGVHNDTTIAHLWHQCLGMNSIFEQLTLMSLPPGTPLPGGPEEVDEFESTLPENLQLKNKPKTLP